MASSSNGNTLGAPLVFDGENYYTWSVKIKTISRAHELWEVVEGMVRALPQLPKNPTMQQMKEFD